MDNFNNNTIDHIYFDVKNMKYDNACFYKSFVNSFINNNDIELEMTKIIQKLSYEWIVENKDVYYNKFGIDIKDIVEMCHEISIEQYIKIYKYYPEDVIDDIDNNRWGSVIEQIALSEIFKIPIFIYTSEKYDIKKDKIVIGKIVNNKPHKGVRYRLYNIAGEKYLDKKPICLLWKTGVHGPHYMTLYLKNEYKLNNEGIPYKI